jgi:hypothetical protein
MATAQDMIPSEADIEVVKQLIGEEVENLAGNEDIAEDSGIWNQADAAFRSFINDSSVQSLKSKGANEPDEWERAKVATTQFYRHVTQMAANGYAVQTSKDMPFQYEAIVDGEEDVQAEDRAERLNLLAKWSMKRDKFNILSMNFWTLIKKYGNIPVMVEWRRRMGTKVNRIPVFSEEDP